MKEIKEIILEAMLDIKELVIIILKGMIICYPIVIVLIIFKIEGLDTVLHNQIDIIKELKDKIIWKEDRVGHLPRKDKYNLMR